MAGMGAVVASRYDQRGGDSGVLLFASVGTVGLGFVP